jgi:hypothetical protein
MIRVDRDRLWNAVQPREVGAGSSLDGVGYLNLTTGQIVLALDPAYFDVIRKNPKDWISIPKMPADYREGVMEYIGHFLFELEDAKLI